ncbi:Hyaluronan synthase [Serratia fonticola]|uniref:Hyaluronan synthase n=1 Tax=Serratia fonticola TaxID=47917 RepID=A0A4U9W347_SERFO|nr:Hyaluronan synthase [Serratia fonticola]
MSSSLEVIIVNDGSTDGSGEIAHRYAAQHPHIKVIDQPNSGVSNARNAGLAWPVVNMSPSLTPMIYWIPKCIQRCLH